jgi:hypothetical protein
MPHPQEGEIMDLMDLTSEEYDDYLDWRDRVAGRDSEGDDSNAPIEPEPETESE